MALTKEEREQEIRELEELFDTSEWDADWKDKIK